LLMERVDEVTLAREALPGKGAAVDQLILAGLPRTKQDAIDVVRVSTMLLVELAEVSEAARTVPLQLLLVATGAVTTGRHGLTTGPNVAEEEQVRVGDPT